MADTGIEEIDKGARPTPAKEDKLAQEQLNIFGELMGWYKANRADDMQYIAQYALPQDSNITTEKTEGVAGWTDAIFDTTLIHAVEVLATGLYNFWTPQNQAWAEYDVPEELNLEEGDPAVKWLGKAGDRIMKELGRSNFYAIKATGDIGLATFATDCIIMDESTEGSELFNFVHWKIGTYVIEENYKGLVDTARQELELTFRQIEQKFSMSGDNIPDKMKQASKGQKGMQKKWKILHCIFPREDSKRLKGRKDGANKPIASVYISVDFRETIRVSGYDENPILCRRFKKWATPYGYGPCYLALPDARQVNYVQQYLDAVAELHVKPRILIPNSQEGDIDLRAGGVSSKGTDPNDRPEEWATVSDYKLGIEMQEQRRQAIKDACFVDAFKLLNSAPLLDKTMTAYEVSARQTEQLQGMTAIDARMIPEFINPLMQRGFGIAFRRGKLGRPPQSLYQPTGAGKQVGLTMPEVIPTSRFNDAMRALKNQGTRQTFEFISPIAEAHPELGLLDNFIMDDVAVDFGRNTGMAPDLIRDRGTIKQPSVAELRAQRAKIAQQQRQAQLAEQLGKASKALGGAPDWMQEQVQDRLEPKKK